MAQLLFVRTGRVEFWPSLHGTELKLGSVAVASSDPFRRALIGVAPFLFGSGLILLLLFFYQNLVLIPEQFRLILVGYGIFEIGNTMFSSRKDMEGTIELTLALGIIIGILYVFGIRFPSEWWVFFSSDAAVAFMQQAAVFIAVPVILDLCVIALFWLLLRVVRH